MTLPERPEPTSRLAAMRGRAKTTLAAFACAAIAAAGAGCGGGDDSGGTIPPGNADQLLNQLDALQTDLETGRCDFVAGHAEEVRAAATQLPATVDPEVKQGVLEATDQIVELSQDPDQCSSSSGATGETDSTSTDTSTAEEPTTAPTTTSTETTTAEEEPTQPEGEQGSDQGGQTETPPQGGGEPQGGGQDEGGGEAPSGGIAGG